MFYLLSFLTGILELGFSFWALWHGYALWEALYLPLAYHIGNLFPIPFSLPVRCVKIASIISLAVTGMFCLSGTESGIFFYILFGVIMIDSAVIQTVRSTNKGTCSAFKKRIFRITGFAASPLAVLSPKFMLLAISLVGLIAAIGYKGEQIKKKYCRQRGFSAVMLYHQLHYFLYAHVTVLAVAKMVGIGFNMSGAWIAASGFVITWITYTSTERLVRGKIKSEPLFFIGHAGLAIFLVIISQISDKYSVWYWILWTILGFFGGTVFTIANIAKKKGCYDKNSMTLSENIGHLGGVLVAVFLAYLYGNDAVNILQQLSAVCALIAIVFMWIIKRRAYAN